VTLVGQSCVSHTDARFKKDSAVGVPISVEKISVSSPQSQEGAATAAGGLDIKDHSKSCIASHHIFVRRGKVDDRC